ncbi:MAG: hypothetical protein ACM3U2_04510, partial [Deltaproteobacteria bacterium]
MKTRTHSGFAFVALAGLVLAVAALQDSSLQSDEPRGKSEKSESVRPASTEPQYNEAGELMRPAGFETWVFVGSNLGLEYSDDATKEKPTEKKEKSRPAKGANFHNVYINPE